MRVYNPRLSVSPSVGQTFLETSSAFTGGHLCPYPLARDLGSRLSGLTYTKLVLLNGKLGVMRVVTIR